MNLNNIVKKIRLFSLLSFIIPLLALSSCMVIYKIVANYDLYAEFNWDQAEDEITLAKYYDISEKVYHKWSFTNCPKYKFTQYLITYDGQSILEDDLSNQGKIDTLFSNNQIKSFVIKKENETNNLCIKNNPIVYYILNKQ